jgi:hypothetical protein
MMKFQRQGCVLSNDYKELSITETPSLYILLGSHHCSYVFLCTREAWRVHGTRGTWRVHGTRETWRVHVVTWSESSPGSL